jgi:hypothetical protein
VAGGMGERLLDGKPVSAVHPVQTGSHKRFRSTVQFSNLAVRTVRSALSFALVFTIGRSGRDLNATQESEEKETSIHPPPRYAALRNSKPSRFPSPPATTSPLSHIMLHAPIVVPFSRWCFPLTRNNAYGNLLVSH